MSVCNSWSPPSAISLRAPQRPVALSARDHRACGLSHHAEVGWLVVASHRFFDPVEIVRLELAGHLGGHRPVPYTVSVDHQFDVIADGLARHAHLLKSLVRVAGVEMKLHRAESHVGMFLDQRCHRLGVLGRVADAVCVHGNAVSEPAQQPPDWLARRFAHNVPRAISSAPTEDIAAFPGPRNPQTASYIRCHSRAVRRGSSPISRGASSFWIVAASPPLPMPVIPSSV